MAEKAIILSFLMMFLVFFNVTMATKVYTVGDYFGWNNSSKVDYSKWSTSKYFQVGDVLVFQFNPSIDNVFKVSAENFAACRAPSPIGLPSNGQEFYSLDAAGGWYFICSIPGRCQAGQKLEVLVHSVAAQPPAPTAQPPVPTPSPSSQPLPSALVPAPAPAHANQPVKAPASATAPINNQTQSPPAPPQDYQPPASSPAASPSSSPGGEKSGATTFSVNFWVTVVGVSFSVFSIPRINY